MTVFNHSGHAFGLSFRGTRELPELSAGDAAPAAAVAAGAAEAAAIDWREPRAEVTPDSRGPHYVDGDGLFQLQVPDVARFEIGPRRIVIHPAPGADERSVRAYLFGSAIGALLLMRGLTVLHGSAVVLPGGGAAVFCGQSTAGKSTLAAALAARGYAVLADDLAAVRLDADGQGWCLPGLARTKLWRDALQRLGLEHRADAGTRVMPDLDKHSLTLVTADAPMLLRRFYELHTLDDGALSVSPVTGIAKLHTLLAHAYRPSFVQTLGRQSELLRSAAALAPRLQMHRIARPRGEQTLDAIVTQLEKQWQG